MALLGHQSRMVEAAAALAPGAAVAGVVLATGSARTSHQATSSRGPPRSPHHRRQGTYLETLYLL